MGKRSEYRFTHHLRERFVQRTQSKYEHLRYCRKNDCEVCKNLIEKSKKEVSDNRRAIEIELARMIDEADENRSYINNTEFMSWYYEKYGFDKRFQFLVCEGLLFVVVIDNGNKVVVTCVRARTHVAGSLHQKYKKI